MDQRKQEHLQALQERHLRRLHMLEEQAAILGIHTPPEIRVEIEDIQAALRVIDAELQGRPLEQPSWHGSHQVHRRQWYWFPLFAVIIILLSWGFGRLIAELQQPPPTAESEPTQVLLQSTIESLQNDVTQLSIQVARPSPISTNQLLAASNFDENDESWQIISRNSTNTAPSKTIHQAIGGNPEGFINTIDLDANTYLLAPSKFLGDKSAAYGGTLNFDLKIFITATNVFTASEVVLVSDRSKKTLLFEADYVPNTYWITYIIPLIESANWTNEATGEAATRQDMMEVLSSLSQLQIRGEFVRGSTDAVGLDNVLLLRHP